MPDRPEIGRLMDAARLVLSRAWDADVTVCLQDPIRTEFGRHTLLLCHVVGQGSPETNLWGSSE